MDLPTGEATIGGDIDAERGFTLFLFFASSSAIFGTRFTALEESSLDESILVVLILFAAFSKA